MPQRDPRTPVEMEERIKLPVAWLVVIGLVAAGFVTHIVLWYFFSSGIVIWPFIFAASVLLIINDAADQSAAGIPPFQAYGLFFGTLIAFFAFVWLVSSTINPWVVVLLALGTAAYLVYDWGLRKQKERERESRRVKGLCVRCCEPVGADLEAECPKCGLPVNAERLDMFRLGKAISMRTEAQSRNTRQVLTGAKASRSQTHMQNLLNRPAKYKRGK